MHIDCRLHISFVSDWPPSLLQPPDLLPDKSPGPVSRQPEYLHTQLTLNDGWHRSHQRCVQHTVWELYRSSISSLAWPASTYGNSYFYFRHILFRKTESKAFSEKYKPFQVKLFCSEFGLDFLMLFFDTASSSVPQILRLNPELLRLWQWQSDTVTPRIDIIHYSEEDEI
jgi:hypothetical protein